MHGRLRNFEDLWARNLPTPAANTSTPLCRWSRPAQFSRFPVIFKNVYPLSYPRNVSTALASRYLFSTISLRERATTPSWDSYIMCIFHIHTHARYREFLALGILFLNWNYFYGKRKSMNLKNSLWENLHLWLIMNITDFYCCPWFLCQNDEII